MKQGEARVRWTRIAIVAAVSLALVVVAAWLIAGRASPESQADCSVVEDTARRWQAAVESLTPAQGATGPSEEFVDDQYLQMAAMVQTAADSVTTPEIKHHLTEWAAAADRLAMVHRDVPGGPRSVETPEEMLAVFSPINDAAGALVELCPGMPSAQS